MVRCFVAIQVKATDVLFIFTVQPVEFIDQKSIVSYLLTSDRSVFTIHVFIFNCNKDQHNRPSGMDKEWPTFTDCDSCRRYVEEIEERITRRRRRVVFRFLSFSL